MTRSCVRDTSFVSFCLPLPTRLSPATHTPFSKLPIIAAFTELDSPTEIAGVIPRFHRFNCRRFPRLNCRRPPPAHTAMPPFWVPAEDKTLLAFYEHHWTNRGQGELPVELKFDNGMIPVNWEGATPADRTRACALFAEVQTSAENYGVPPDDPPPRPSRLYPRRPSRRSQPHG